MSVRRNLVANLAGSAWTGVVALAFIPVYLRTIGAEGYGLIGFFVTFASLMTIFDGGFGAATARELARITDGGDPKPVRDLVRTLEWIFWGIALTLGGVVAAGAALIVDYWLNLGALGHAEAFQAVQLMGLALALQWPIAYYTGCLVGLQRQVGLNLVNIVALTCRFGGAAAVLIWLSPTVTAFFAWQAFTTLIHVGSLRIYLWWSMPGDQPARFSMIELRHVGHFALSVGGINVLGLLLTQIDKVVLSKLLSLEQFGYYMLAASLASVISRVAGPVFNATYPRLAELAKLGDELELAKFYRSACRIMAFAIVPLSVWLIVFGKEITQAWTSNPAIASDLQWVVALLAAGSLCNGLMTIPYALQLAKGWTGLALGQNIVAVVLLVPLLFQLNARYGLIGAASVWFILNLGYVLISAPLMYSRLLRREQLYWYLFQVALPISLALPVMIYIRSKMPSEESQNLLVTSAWLVFAGVISQIIATSLLFSSSARKIFVMGGEA